MLTRDQTAPNDLEAFWMPFTANRHFKAHPRLINRAEGMHYTMTDGRQLLDATAGLWCCNAGHAAPRIVEAIRAQAAELDFAPSFQWGHPKSFALASQLAHLFPGDLDHAFFTNSGSESVDTALKIALAYQRAIGQGTRTRLIGRERGYHGVGFGGISVGGMVKNRMYFGSLLTGVDHLPHTLDLERNRFSRGQPEHGAELADVLEKLVALHDASTIAAVIVEPVAGSIGVYPPPAGYLQRLRAITEKHGILLIFDEVITAFGRLGTGSAAEYFDVHAGPRHHGQGPDLGHGADGCGDGEEARLRRDRPRQRGRAGKGDRAVPRLHLFRPPPGLRRGPGDARDLPRGAAVRAGQGAGALLGGAAARPARSPARDRHPQHRPDGCGRPRARAPARPGERAYDAMLLGCEKGVMLRITADTIAMSPPLIVTEAQIDEMVGLLGEVLDELD